MFNIDNYITNINNISLINKDTTIANYMAKYPFIFPQLNIWGGVNKTTRLALEAQNRLDVRWLKTHEITRIIEPWKSVDSWFIATIMFDNVIPIGILRNTDNREDRYNKFLPINYTQHNYAARYLFNFVKADPGPETEPYDVIGAFSGDVQTEYRSINMDYYDLSDSNDKNKLNSILDYTETYSF